MKSKSIYRIMVTIVIVVLFAFSATSFASDVRGAPTFMSGFPMLAGDNVMIMWIPIPGAAKYNIYLNGKKIGEAPAPPFTTSAPTDPGTYKYTITGVDAGDEEGMHSTEGILAIVKLEDPPDFTHRFLGEVLNIRWSIVANAVIYDVFRSDTKDGDFKLIASVNETRYVDSDISETEAVGKCFYYKIISKDKFNKLSPGKIINEVCIKEDTGPGYRVIPTYTLKVRRSKKVQFLMPMGANTNIKAAWCAKMYNDGETIILSDPFQHRLAVIDKYGDMIGTIGSSGPAPEQYMAPFKLHVDDNNNIYVSDTEKRDGLWSFTESGALRFAIKGHVVTEDEARTKFDPPKVYTEARFSGIAVYNDVLYACEQMSGTIQMYDAETGDFQGYLTSKETGKVHIVGFPNDMTVDKEGRLYVGRSLERVVNVIDTNTTEHVRNIGSAKTFIGSFMSVSGLAINPEGHLVVTDSVMSSVQVFNKDDGSYMYHIGDVKVIPDKRSKEQRPFVPDFLKPNHPNFNGKGQFVLFTARKGFLVREFLGEEIWDATIDAPEGVSPQ